MNTLLIVLQQQSNGLMNFLPLILIIVVCKCHLMGYNDHRRILVLYDSSSDEKTERIEKLP